MEDGLRAEAGAERRKKIIMKIDLEGTKRWFEGYLQGFELSDPMLEMKHLHSYEVMKLGERLTAALGWDEDRSRVGVAASLLHDIGRFSQYRDFKTYHDGDSIDHGDRGAAVLEAEFPRTLADSEAREAIIEAVRWHNKKELPELDEAVAPFCLLVRDADKLDVFKLVQRCIDEDRVEELLPRHKPGEPLSEVLLEEVERTGKGSYKNAASLLDYLLIQLSWVGDMNFVPSLRLLKQSGVLESIFEHFPMDDARVASLLDRLTAPCRSA